MKFPVMMVTVLSAGVLAGCASGPKYACSMPDGVGCKSVSEVYAGARHEPMPGASASRTLSTGGSKDKMTTGMPRPVIATVKPGEAVLTTPKYARMWIDRWEDSDGDMHDETFIYLRLDNGSWVLKK